LNRFYPDEITKSKKTPDLVLNKEKAHLFVRNKCFGFVDETGTFRRPDIKNIDFMNRFEAVKNDIPNYGYSNKSVWLMMRIMNLADAKWLLEIENNRINEVDLFVVEHDRIINSKKLGDHFPYRLNPLKDANPIFKIDMIENQEYLIFLKLKSTEDLKFPVNFWQESELFQQISTRKIIWGIYFGFILLISLYNLFLWLVIRDNSLIYYILYVLSFGALQAELYGFFYQYIWSNSWLNDRFHLVFLNFSSFFMIYFTIEFLSFKDYIPQLIKPVKIFSLLFLLFSVILFFHYDWYSNFIGIGLTFLLLLLQTWVVYHYFFRGIRIIRFYALAMVSISLAAIVVALKNLNIISAMNQEYYLMLGSMVEIVLFSVAFGDKLRQSQKEYKLQQNIRNEISTNLHDDLAASLSSLTMYSELSRQRANKQSPEIANRFENISQKSREILRMVREVVWEINPSNDQSEEWLERIIIFARDIFDSKQIELQMDIEEDIYQVILPVLQRREIYLICKEAINNIARHAEATEVKLTGVFVNKQLTISIKDNGIGFNEDLISKGNGLDNLQKRANKINAKLTVTSQENKGTEVQLILNI
jgi:signal transduction histidine kinase